MENENTEKENRVVRQNTDSDGQVGLNLIKSPSKN